MSPDTRDAVCVCTHAARVCFFLGEFPPHAPLSVFPVGLFSSIGNNCLRVVDSDASSAAQAENVRPPGLSASSLSVCVLLSRTRVTLPHQVSRRLPVPLPLPEAPTRRPVVTGCRTVRDARTGTAWEPCSPSGAECKAGHRALCLNEVLPP